MIKVGITGGIGSGKSYICKLFSDLGIPIYDSDKEIRPVVNLKEVRDKIIERFGNVYKDDILDRKELSKIAFSDTIALNDLNNIVYQYAVDNFNKWVFRQNSRYIIVESAILLEMDLHKDLDCIITVVAPEELRIERAIKRDSSDVESIKSRIKSQWSDQQRIEKSHFVINNDGSDLSIRIKEINTYLLRHLYSFNY